MLKDHPFAVEAFFESSLVMTFAVKKEQLESLIPACLALDVFQKEWAFVAVAMVQTKGLRIKGTPSFLGNDFFLIGYRIFVRYTNTAGKRLRGLYILKSETDKTRMKWIGNLFTHYKYAKTDIDQRRDGHNIQINSIQSNFNIEVETSDGAVSLPNGSPFQDWKSARRFAGPLPFTFTYKSQKKEVLIIQGVRQNWTPTPVKVINYKIDFLKKLGLKNPVLASAFIIRDIPYFWKKGKIEQWKN